MKFRDGYLCSYEDLEQLPVEILEDIIIRIYRDDYLNRDAKQELLKDYLEERKHKLDKAFRYTDDNLKRLREMNNLIEQQSIEAIRTAYTVYQGELAEKAAHPDGYVDVEVKPILKVPADLYCEGEEQPYFYRKGGTGVGCALFARQPQLPYIRNAFAGDQLLHLTPRGRLRRRHTRMRVRVRTR